MSTEQLSAPLAAPAAGGPLRPRVVTGTAQLAELADTWHALAAGLGPIEQFDWAQTCAQTVAAGERLAVVAIERDGQCDALAPLVGRRSRGIRRLAHLGVGDLFEPMDLVARDCDSLAALAKALVRLNAPLWFERLPASSPAIAAIKHTCRGRAVVVERPAANCPYITLDASWAQAEQHLNSGRRSDLRRAARKAEQLGAVTTEIIAPAADDIDRLFDEAVAIEARSWKGEAGTALAHDPRRAAFYRQYAHAAGAAGVLRMCFLRIAGKGVAMQMAIQQGGAFWLLKVGYHAEFAPCSPGLLLMRDTINHAARSGLASYEFLGRAESWTKVWTEQERETVSLRVYPYGPRGLTALALDAAAALTARWRKS
jgi:CelD/BcsL family acetyltransferase involved in cellulose biosynthesis